jgi:hypothetical protein
MKDLRSKQELVKSRRSANIAALHALAEQYPQEYRALQRVELEKRGFKQEPTPEEKAREQISKLAEQYPQAAIQATRDLVLSTLERAEPVSSDEDSR